MIRKTQHRTGERARWLEQVLPRVRRGRHFEVELVERPVVLRTPRDFSEPYRRTVVPFLRMMETCRLFVNQSENTTIAGEWIAEVECLRWQKAGARPERWVDLGTGPEERARQRAGVDLELTSELIDDRLFWWWAFGARFPVWSAFLTSPGRFKSRGFFSRVCNPLVYGGPFPTSSDKPALSYVRRATGRSERIGFVVLPGLTLVIVANTANCERLFVEAVERARY